MAPERSPAADLDLEALAAIIESSDDAILSKDRDARITSWNSAAARMYGYSAEEAIGSPVAMLVPPERAGEERRILARILAGERVANYETERVRKDGRRLFVSLTVSPVRDRGGEIVGASVIGRDVTGLRRSRELAERLQEVTSALSREATTERIVTVILEQAVAGLGAAAGALGFVEGEEVVLAGSAGYSAAGLAAWQRFPLAAEVPMSAAITGGEPIWVSNPAELTERYPALAGAKVRFGALAVLPLISADDGFGALALSFDEERRFDLQERTFLLATTQNAAASLARSRTYDAQLRAVERERFLSEAGVLLAESLDPDTALSRLASLAVETIADWCGVDLVAENGELVNVAVAHVDPEFVELAHQLRERYPTDPASETGAPNVVRTGRSELYGEIPEELLEQSAHDDEHLRLLRELGLRSAMIVPLRSRGQVLGAITFVLSDPEQRYDEADLALAEDLARRAALAIDNAMLYRREHEAALTLQRALLPDTLPTVPGIELEARYEPATAELEVGGDWYEVVAVDDGSVAVTIGDIAGRGISAASVMGRVRPALRAYVIDGHGPAAALERLDRLIKELAGPRMTTVFHLQYDPGSEHARYVRAGHPPALVRLPDGEIVELAGGGTPPLGILDDVECREHEVSIPRGSLLLLYTDGLIERRGSDLGAALEQLKAALATAPQGAAECLDSITEALRTEEIPDDIAMLAMSIAPAQA